MYVLSRIINSSKRTGYVVGVEDAREGKAMGDREDDIQEQDDEPIT